MTMRCCKCGTIFIPKRDRSYRCPPCKSAYNREHYLANIAAYVARAARRKAIVADNNTTRLIRYLQEHPCVDCGEADPLVLEFDHLRDKVYDVGYMVAAGRAWSSIVREIEKCEVRCANCHRRVTAKRANWRRAQKSIMGLEAFKDTDPPKHG